MNRNLFTYSFGGQKIQSQCAVMLLILIPESALKIAYYGNKDAIKLSRENEDLFTSRTSICMQEKINL